jgi:hypothetical protein
MGHPAILVALFAALAVVVWWATGVWNAIDTQMPAAGWIALSGGVIFSLVVGCGLFWLMFQSNSRGYDEAAVGQLIMEDDEDADEDEDAGAAKAEAEPPKQPVVKEPAPHA